MKNITAFALLISAAAYGQTNTFPATGNVGIGTTNPAEKLELNGNLRITGPTTGTTHSELQFYRGTGNKFASIGQADLSSANSTFDIHHFNGNDIRFLNTGVEQLRILGSNGYVGIGTATPAYNLDVSSGANTTIKIGSTVNTGYSDLIFKGSLNSWKISKSPSGTGTTSAPGTLAFTYNTNTYGGDRPVLQLNHNVGSWDVQVGTSDRTIFGSSSLGVAGSIGATQIYLNNSTTGSMTSSFGLSSGLILGVEGRIGARQMFIGGGTNANTIGLGTTLLLAVDGNMGARGVTVSLASAFPDYVFKPSYSLLPLSEVEKYIKEYGRLPEVPSAEKVEKDGMELGMMTSLLVQKIEELTLHMIEMNKKIDKLEKDNQLLRGTIKE